MKRLILFLTIVCSFQLLAGSGDEVRNGGGFAEQYFSYALKTLSQTIDSCFKNLQCAPDPTQKEVLKKIKDSLDLEIESEILTFTTNVKRPGFFTVDGVERMAVTGSFVGSPIYYNMKLLYQYGNAQVRTGQAIQSLIHELGHHQRISSHDYLEALGAEVRENFENTMSELPYKTKVSHLPINKIGFSVIANGSQEMDFDKTNTLVLIFPDQIINITNQFESLLSQCEENSLTPIMNKSLHFFNLHWDFKNDETTSPDKFLSGNVMVVCKNKYSRIHRKNFSFNMKIKTLFSSQYKYLSSELVQAPVYLYTEKFKSLRDGMRK